jgi:GNAT superfamily N-acetyltransferase
VPTISFSSGATIGAMSRNQMPLPLEIREVESLDTALIGALTSILVRVVEAGASVGFIAPLSEDRARTYWDAVPRPGVHLYVASVHSHEGASETVVGTAQLHLAGQENGRHRAEVAKVLVHPDWQRRGIASALLRVIEARASDLGRTTLLLDTREGDPSNQLYTSAGWTQVGRIAEYCRSNDGKLDATTYYAKWLAR